MAYFKSIACGLILLGATLAHSQCVSTLMPVANGGTGACIAAIALSNLGGQPLLGYTPANCTAGTAANNCLKLDGSGLVPAANLPNPTTSALGGMEAINAVSHEWIDSINTSGVPHLSQPSYADITGVPQLANTIAVVSHEWLASYTASTGNFTLTQPGFGDLTGTLGTAQGPSGLTGILSDAAGTLTALGTTGSGSVVLAASPTLSGTPVLPASYTVGGNTITQPSSAGTLQIASQGTITAGPNTFGSSAVNTVIAQTIAVQAGYFTNLVMTAALGGTCTTAPTFNVFDGTSNTGTAKISTSTTQTKGTSTNQTQTRTFAAGDLIGIYISTAGATCTTDTWTVSAQYSTP